MLKKILLTIFSFWIISISSLTLFAPAANAQWYQPTYDNFIATVGSGTDSELYGERYTYAQVHWIFYSMVSIVFNSLSPNLLNCIISIQPGGAFPDLPACTSLITEVIERFINAIVIDTTQPVSPLAVVTQSPVSSTVYFRDIASRLHLAQPANAQVTGFGYTAANIVLDLWREARDLSYSLLVILIVVMAFMIMFRVKISPQTVITVQSALPKVIGALIAITFSYAIAGLLLDLMYVVIGLMATMLRDSGFSTASSWQELFAELAYSTSIFNLMYAYLIMFILIIAGIGVAAIFGSILIPGGPQAITLIEMIVILIITIWLLILTFKIFFMLLKTFVGVIFTIIIGPFQILFGSLRGGGFGKWITNLTIQLAVYPITGFMFFFAFLFLRASLPDFMDGLIPDDSWPFSVKSLDTENAWRPPFTVGTGAVGVLWLATSLVIITLIPKIPDILKSALSGRPFGYGSAIGEGFAFPIMTGRVGASSGVEYTTSGLLGSSGRLGSIGTALGIQKDGPNMQSRIIEGIKRRAEKGF